MTETGVARWLPGVVLDAPAGEPGAPRLVDALLAAVDRQRALLEADVDALWHDLFVESCADWAVPYIGSLLGLPPDAERAEVAYAVALRRRKGTPAALEDFAEVVTGLTARVVEGWQVTLWAQRLGHPMPLRTASVDLRDASRHRVGTAFERTRRSVTPGGRWSPRAVTAVVWPWQVSTFVATQAAPLDPATDPRRFALHPLGAHAPLYLKPRPPRLVSDTGGDPGLARTGDEADAPVRATYDVMAALAAPGQVTYGASLALSADHPLASAPGDPVPPLLALTVGGTPVAWGKVRFGVVSPGAPAPAPPAADQVLVDPGRGLVEVGSGLSGPVRATWHRPAPGGIGALVSRADADPAARAVIVVNPAAPPAGNVVATLAAAVTLGRTRAAALPAGSSRHGVPDVEIRLETSDRIAAAPIDGTVGPGIRWRVVAPPLLTPTIVGDLAVNLAGGCVSLEGFSLAGRLRAGPALRGLALDGVTMDPAFRVEVDPAAWELDLSARRCVLGPIRADLAALPIVLTDCVVDGRRRLLRPCDPAAGGAAEDAVGAAARFGPVLHANGVTFAGTVRAEAVDAVDCLFADGVVVVQRQEGCLRHCYLGPEGAPAAHPATYRCGPFPEPTFVSEGFEAAGYYALSLEPEHPLLTAASDGGEVGAYHHARRGARIARLRRRIDEFVPVGLRSAVAVAQWEE